MFLYFDILTISPILNLGFLSLISLLESRYVHDFISTGFYLIVLWSVLLWLLTISSNLPIHIFSWYWCLVFINLFFKVLINFSTITDVPSLCVEYISISFFVAVISVNYYKIRCLYLPIFFWFTPFGFSYATIRFFQKFLKNIMNSCFFEFLDSFLAFFKWSTSTICKSWLS